MHCRLFVKFAVLTLLIDVVFCETTKEPQIEMVLKNTSKEPTLQELVNDSKNGKQRWIQQLPLISSPKNNQPNAQRLQQRDAPLIATPHSVTKLAKSLHYGFDPYFSKGYFEPFETRPKPITLVAFRKNGLTPRKTAKGKDVNVVDSDVAELQSPFNSVSNFWADRDENLPRN